MSPFGTCREVFFHRFKNQIATMLVQSNDFFNVLIQIILIHVSICNTLVKVGGVQVSALFDFNKLGQQAMLSSNPAKTQARAEDFGEGAQEHNQALGIHRFQGRQNSAFITQLAIRIILQYRQVVFINNFHEFLAAFQRPGAAGRVLEVRDYIDELAVRGGFQNFVQLFRNQAAVVSRNLNEVRLISIEGIQCAEVGRAFAENNIAGIQEQLACEVQALLRAGSNQNVIRINVGVIFIGHAFSNFCTQGRTAFGGCILQQLTAFFQYQVMRNLGNFFNREQLRCRQTASKGNNIRLSG